TGNALTAPGTNVITVTVNDNGTPNLSGSTTFTNVVTREDARATYSGLMFFSTPSSNTSTATIVLTATIQDITATTNAAGDSAFGDIRNARVTFVNRDNGNAVLGTGLVPVLVDPADIKTGTVSCSVPVDLGAANSMDFAVGIIVTNYYTRDASDDDTIIAVSKPLAGFVTGGGYIANQASAGQYAGTVDAKSNFGFNVKNNSTGKNLQGHANIIFRRLVGGVWRTYQI